MRTRACVCTAPAHVLDANDYCRSCSRCVGAHCTALLVCTCGQCSSGQPTAAAIDHSNNPTRPNTRACCSHKHRSACVPHQKMKQTKKKMTTARHIRQIDGSRCSKCQPDTRWPAIVWPANQVSKRTTSTAEAGGRRQRDGINWFCGCACACACAMRQCHLR